MNAKDRVLLDIVRKLSWRVVTTVEDYSDPDDWVYEADYKGVRVACGYIDGGPVAWVGHPTEERWIDSVACDGSFESGAARAIELAEEMFAEPVPNMKIALGLAEEKA